MARDDLHVIVYKILSYLYRQLKAGEKADVGMIDERALSIPSLYWMFILEELIAMALTRVGFTSIVKHYYTRPSKEITKADFAIASRRYSRYSEITATEKALQDLSKEHGFAILKLR